MSRPPVRRLGFSVLATGVGEFDGGKPVANIVFIHGLRGHPQRTWEQARPHNPVVKQATKRSSCRFFDWGSKKSTSSAVIENDGNMTYWPQDLLAKEIKNARIMTYGYDADVIGDLFRGPSKNNITQHGRDLIFELEREVHGEPIIFVAHSLGGILVKEGLQFSKSHMDPRYQELHRCTKHVVFLGVPHRGSDMASMGKVLTRLANAAFQDTNKPIVSSLAVDEELLDRIHDEFMKMVWKEDFTVHSFQEGLGLSGLKGFGGKVVNDSSSKLGHPLESVETINENHMQMARFGDAEHPGYRKVSRVIAGYVERLQLYQVPAESTARGDIRNTLSAMEEKRYFRVPHISNRYFVGREKELEWLRSHLEDRSSEQEQRRLVIWGTGGVGKTQLVSTYALRNQSKYSAVFWTTASSDYTLRRSYADIAKYLGIIHPLAGDQQTAIDSVKDWFVDHKAGDWLLVIDNADKLDELDIEAIIPPTNKGSVIITSQNIQAEGFGPAIELGDLDAKDATTLLLQRAAICSPTPANEIVAAEITKLLGYRALAIEHAGAYVQSVGGTLRDYQLQFQSNRRDTLEKSPRVSLHKESVFKTFTISFDAIKERNFTAAKLMCFLGFLDPEAIPENTLLSTDKSSTYFHTMVVADRHTYLEAVQELLSFSLVRIKTEGDKRSISVHPLVHFLIRARLNPANQWGWNAKVAYWLAQSCFATSADAIYLPHVREQMQHISDLPVAPADLVKRRTVYCILGILLYQYMFSWHNQGTMDELYGYSKMVSKVLEEDIADTSYCSIMAMIMITDVEISTVEYSGSNMTSIEVGRRFLLKRMAAPAVSALEKASLVVDTAKSTTNTADTTFSGVLDAERDIFLNMGDLTTAINNDLINESVTTKANDVNNSAERSRSVEEHRHPLVESDQQTPDRQRLHEHRPAEIDSQMPNEKPVLDYDVAETDPQMQEKLCLPVPGPSEDGSGEFPVHQQPPPETHLSMPETPSLPECGPSEDTFRPRYFNDVFPSITESMYIKAIVAYLNGLIKTYYSQGRTAEANLLLSFSTLPLNPPHQISSETSTQSTLEARTAEDILEQEKQLSNMFIEAGRLAGRRDLQGLLDLYHEIIVVGDHSSMPVAGVTLDYGTMMNKIGKPEEAERAIRLVFYGEPKGNHLSEAEIARKWQSAYVWIRKTLAVALRMQGRAEMAEKILLETLTCAEELFGCSLWTLHTTLLLHFFYVRDRDPHSLKSEAKAKRYEEDFTTSLEKLYGGAGNGNVVYEAGFQMCMILWTQGALEEAVYLFDALARLTTRSLGEDNPVAEMARRAEAITRTEWKESLARNKDTNLLKYGTMVFSRNMNDLTTLLK